MERLGIYTLTSIQAGIYICVSAIMAGHILFADLGMKGALLGIGVGSIILWLVSLIFVRLSLERRVVLIDIVDDVFGKNGARLGGLAMGVSLTGWFAIQTEIMAKGIVSVYPIVPKTFWIIFLTALVTRNVMKGMKWIGRIADFSVPILLIIMGIAACKLYDASTPLPESNWSLDGIALIIAFSLAGVIDIPTYFWVSKGARESYIATSIVYLLLLPAMALLGVGFGWFSQSSDFIEALLGLGGSLWKFCVVIFIVLAGWTTNNGNLYSAALALKPCVPISQNKLLVIMGTCSAILATSGMLSRFFDALSAMGIIMAALGGALIVYFAGAGFRFVIPSDETKRFYQGFIVVGAAMGLLSQFGFVSISRFGFIDSFFVTVVFAICYEVAFTWKRNLQKQI